MSDSGCTTGLDQITLIVWTHSTDMMWNYRENGEVGTMRMFKYEEGPINGQGFIIIITILLKASSIVSISSYVSLEY